MSLNVLRDPPAALLKLMAGFHQDFEADAVRVGSFEAAVEQMPLDWLNNKEQQAMQPLLSRLVAEESPADLKGLLGRSDAAYFFTAAQAETIFKVWAEALESRR